MLYSYIPIGMAKKKIQTIPSVAEDAEQLDLSYIGNVVALQS